MHDTNTLFRYPFDMAKFVRLTCERVIFIDFYEIDGRAVMVIV